MAGLTKVSWIVSRGRRGGDDGVLLVFQLGQPRIFMAMARDGLLPPVGREDPSEVPDAGTSTIVTGLLRRPRALFADENEIFDLTNIGTLAAFVIVCLGVLVLRIREPERPRPFRVPMVGAVALLGAAACVYLMKGLPLHAWERFGIWLVIGLVLYFVYGMRHRPGFGFKAGAKSHRRASSQRHRARCGSEGHVRLTGSSSRAWRLCLGELAGYRAARN